MRLFVTARKNLTHQATKHQTPFRTMSLQSNSKTDFPDSTAVPSSFFKWPGVTQASTDTTRRVLEENDRKHDIYEKLRYAHNHFPHSILTRYALGAPPKLLEDTWKHDEKRLATLDPKDDHRETGDLSRLPEKITTEDWDDPKTLGFKDAYARYLVFFHSEIGRLGPLGAVKEYVFSPKANWNSRNGHPAPQMLVRMVAGVLHPFIHTGFGLEFRDRVVLAEALAQAAVHDHSVMRQLFPSKWPEDELHPRPGKGLEVKKDEWNDDVIVESSSGGLSLLEIFAELQQDKHLAAPPYNPNMLINDRLTAVFQGDNSDRLLALIDKWGLSDAELRDGPGGWHRKLDEVGVLVTLLACATGRKGEKPRIDFFLMHTLTSSMFLPAFMAVLEPPARRAVLKTYTAALFAMSIARGKPNIDVSYLMQAPLFPVGPGTTPKPGASRDCLSNPSDEATRGAWPSIVESALYATDSHVPKSIRALAHYAATLASTPVGGLHGTTVNGRDVLPGSSQLDGTMFVRAAGLVMDVMGWCREGQEAGSWTFDPIGYDEVWRRTKSS